MRRRFRQVDVFTDVPYRGNPVAVVLDGDGLTTEEMQRFANWTNLSETTFVLPPTEPEADYRVRIFTPVLELPFAGHPTLGTCHAWRTSGGRPQRDDVVVQECAAGLITIRTSGDRLAFAAPPARAFGPGGRGVRRAHRVGPAHQPGRHPRRRVGRQRTRLGGGHARERRGGAGAAARADRLRSRCRRAVPSGVTPCDRGSRRSSRRTASPSRTR